MIKVEMTFLYQWRIRVELSGEGGGDGGADSIL
jgi:hypothetical protein